MHLDDDDGRWITTENGHKVHINGEGVPDKGNPHVIAAMHGKTKGNATTGKSISRDEAFELITSAKSPEERMETALRIEKDLPVGTRIEIAKGAFVLEKTPEGKWKERNAYHPRRKPYIHETAESAFQRFGYGGLHSIEFPKN